MCRGSPLQRCKRHCNRECHFDVPFFRDFTFSGSLIPWFPLQYSLFPFIELAGFKSKNHQRRCVFCDHIHFFICADMEPALTHKRPMWKNKFIIVSEIEAIDIRIVIIEALNFILWITKYFLMEQNQKLLWGYKL